MTDREKIAVVLAPCPFCGKPGSIDEERSKGNPEHVVFVPSCSDSDCLGVLVQSFARRSEAIAAWNRRAPYPSHRSAAEEIDAILRDVAELPDRTSPEDQPDMMLVTADELRAIIARSQPSNRYAEAIEDAAKVIEKTAGAYYGEHNFELAAEYRTLAAAIRALPSTPARED